MNIAGYERSPELLAREDAVLVVVDVQGKLVSLVNGHERLVWNIGRLIDGARLLGVPVCGTEQYPQGLGPTTPELAAKLGDLPAKTTFSCLGCAPFQQQLAATACNQVVLVGIEAHVCVLQTALDLLAAGYRVYVVVDAVGSRHEIDYRTALARIEASGGALVTTEMALFEWCREAGNAEFKELSKLVRQPGP